jgi:esterase/lipase
MQKVQFLSEGKQIKGTLITPEKIKEKNPGVIFFHGLTSSEKGYIPYAEKLAEYGIVGLTLSVRGHGESEGDFTKLTVKDVIIDGLNAYDFFAKYEFIDPNRIGLLGKSIGGAIVSCVSAQRKVKSILLTMPAAYTDEMMRMPFSQIEPIVHKIFRNMDKISETKACQAIAKFEGDLLVVIGEKDDIVPLDVTSEYFNIAKKAHRKKKVITKDSLHVLEKVKWRKQFENEVIRWFVETL